MTENSLEDVANRKQSWGSCKNAAASNPSEAEWAV